MEPPASPKVSLPSIHEMFPEHLMTKTNDSDRNRNRQSSRHDGAGPSSSSSPPPGRYRLPESSPGLPPAPRDRAYSTPSRPGSSRPTEIVSFDVLRSDPSSSSLQHLVSSTTLPSRVGNMGFHPSQACVDRGTAPAFRVSVKAGSTPPPPESPLPLSSSLPSSSHLSSSTARAHAYQQPEPSNNGYIKDRASQPPSTAVSETSSSTYPAIISFPVSAGSAASPAAGGGSTNPEVPPADDGAMSEDEGTVGPEGPSNGKKHICPTCLKRFNRPSSLRIHVNTHTGATPFRCPWPNCGREFNVNSNMRRHYRNHTAPGFSRQPNDNNRKRRRRIEPAGGLPPQPGDLHHPSSVVGGVPTLRRVQADGFLPPHHPAYVGSDESDGEYDSDYGANARRGREYDDEEFAYGAGGRPRSWGGSHLSQSMSSRVSAGSSRSTLSPQQHQYSSPPRGHRPSSSTPYHGASGPVPPPPPPGAGPTSSQHPSHHQPTPPPHPSHPPQAAQYHPHGQYHHHRPQLSPRHHPYPLPSGNGNNGPARFRRSSTSSVSPSPSPSPPPPQSAVRYHLSETLASSLSLSQKEQQSQGQGQGHGQVYNLSAPYSRSLVGESERTVSTTLRPAFHPVGGTGGRESQRERVSEERGRRYSSFGSYGAHHPHPHHHHHSPGYHHPHGPGPVAVGAGASGHW